MRRLVLLLCLLPLFAAAFPAATATAQAGLCFQQVPDCITSTRFARFWTDYGGLPVFGLPLSDDHNETVGDQRLKVQYFERFRFEEHKENEQRVFFADSIMRDGVDAECPKRGSEKRGPPIEEARSQQE